MVLVWCWCCGCGVGDGGNSSSGEACACVCNTAVCILHYVDGRDADDDDVTALKGRLSLGQMQLKRAKLQQVKIIGRKVCRT